jgi:formylglycine-generating enzyme
VSAPCTLLVPGGTFSMGCDDGRPDEAPLHDVTVKAFRLGRTPVTNAEYAPFLATGRVDAPPHWSDRDYAHPAQPVVGVTWFDAVAYAEWLSRPGTATFRLPTEAEWELAARGGRDGAATAWGDAVPPDEIPAGPLAGPWLTARGTPNGFGLLDITTIVHEWCLDWYGAGYYVISPARDPHGPDEGERRSSRGGSWRHHVRFARPAARSSLLPHLRYADYGFRVLQEIA